MLQSIIHITHLVPHSDIGGMGGHIATILNALYSINYGPTSITKWQPRLLH